MKNCLLILLAVLLSGTYGCFISFDLFTFFLFNEITLIPTYLLIGIFGSGKKEWAAMKLNLPVFAPMSRTQSFLSIPIRRPTVNASARSFVHGEAILLAFSAIAWAM